MKSKVILSMFLVCAGSLCLSFFFYNYPFYYSTGYKEFQQPTNPPNHYVKVKNFEVDKNSLVKISVGESKVKSENDLVMGFRPPKTEMKGQRRIDWLRPVKKGKEIGVIALFHSCQQTGEDWFVFPEHLNIVMESLRKRYAVVSFTSSGDYNCWDLTWPAKENKEVENVISALKWFLTKESLSHLPVYAIGSARGSSFVSILMHQFPFKACALLLSSGHPESIKEATSAVVPKLYFQTMNRDTTTYESMEASLPTLRDKGIEVELDRVSFKVVTQQYFMEKVPGISEQVSKQIFKYLKEMRYIVEDNKKYYFVANPLNEPVMDGIEIEDSILSRQLLSQFVHLYSFSELSSEEVIEWIKGLSSSVK